MVSHDASTQWRRGLIGWNDCSKKLAIVADCTINCTMQAFAEKMEQLNLQAAQAEAVATTCLAPLRVALEKAIPPDPLAADETLVDISGGTVGDTKVQYCQTTVCLEMLSHTFSTTLEYRIQGPHRIKGVMGKFA